MYYIVLIAGLSLIFYSLKTRSKGDLFTQQLDQKLDERRLQQLEEQLSEVLQRTEIIEQYLMTGYNEQIERHEVLDIEVPNNEENTSPDIQTDEILKEDDKSHISDRNQIIYNLLDKGYNLEQICETLKVGKGEVLLRIGLRK